jgi:ATP-dependent exoDNAse (exonuclease V) beta subunit
LTTTLRYHHTLLADEPWLAVYEALVDALDAAPSPLTPWPAPRQQREAALYGDWLRCLAQLQDTLKNASQQPLNQAELLATVRSRLAELADLGDWSPELSEADREAMAALDAVQLLTIHGAKGLEFDVVFLAFVDSAWTSQAAGEYLQLEPQPAPKPGFGLSMTRYQGLPTAAHQVIEAIWRKPRQEAERQRLFYVALTRAKHRLYLLMSENLPGWVDTVATMGQAPPP